MKSVLILGVGGTGSRAVNLLQKKISRAGRNEDVKIVSVVFDTNAADEKNIDSASVISLSENATVGMVERALADVSAFRTAYAVLLSSLLVVPYVRCGESFVLATDTELIMLFFVA